MKKIDAEHERIEHLMQQVRPPGPSPQLKDRVTSAAGEAWGRAPLEVPWQIPLRRLAVSAAAAVLVVSLANALGNSVVPKQSHKDSSATASELADLDDLYPAEYGVFVAGLGVGGHRPSRIRGPALGRYLEQVQEMLDEDQSAETTRTPASRPGRSRLVPVTPPTQSWS